jgi:hypothetical protein
LESCVAFFECDPSCKGEGKGYYHPSMLLCVVRRKCVPIFVEGNSPCDVSRGWEGDTEQFLVKISFGRDDDVRLRCSEVAMTMHAWVSR